jgi:UPF0755 protein
MKHIYKIFISISVILIIICALNMYFYYRHLQNFAHTPINIKKDIDIIIDPGMSAKDIGSLLKKHGIINNERIFSNYLRFILRKTRNLEAGEYAVLTNMTPYEIIKMIQDGRRKERKFTIIEGSRKEDIAQEIEKSGLISAEVFLASLNDLKLLEEFNIPITVPGGVEGYLYPDTYRFTKGVTAQDIIRHMHKKLLSTFSEDMKVQMEKLGWNLHQVLTLASIIEKETAKDSERPRISAVFHNRLRIKMRLQTDPTVIYGINTQLTRGVRYAHLKIDHPYNTYIKYGLPPGPISSAGIKSIRAALFPEKTNELYFVSRNDGSHEFCPTFACHKAAIKRWRSS